MHGGAEPDVLQVQSNLSQRVGIARDRDAPLVLLVIEGLSLVVLVLAIDEAGWRLKRQRKWYLSGDLREIVAGVLALAALAPERRRADVQHGGALLDHAGVC